MHPSDWAVEIIIVAQILFLLFLLVSGARERSKLIPKWRIRGHMFCGVWVYRVLEPNKNQDRSTGRSFQSWQDAIDYVMAELEK